MVPSLAACHCSDVHHGAFSRREVRKEMRMNFLMDGVATLARIKWIAASRSMAYVCLGGRCVWLVCCFTYLA